MAIRASGLQLYEIATPDVGLASAGWAARAQDASTLFKNPAGMSLLDGATLQAGLQLTYGDVAFSPNDDTSPQLGTDGGGNAIGALPAMSFFYVQPLGEKWRVGVGTLSYFGLVEDYGPDWVGRYYVQKSSLIGVSLLPTVSYQVCEWLSLGAGLNAMYGYLDTEVAVNNLDPRIGDGQLTVDDRTWGFGANAGLLIKASDRTRVGINYLSPVALDFEATPEFSNLGPALGNLLNNPSPLDLGMTVPQSVMLSVFHQLTDQLALMADFGWQNWSAFGQVEVGVNSDNPRDLTTDLNYQDTFHGAVGAQYQICPKWQVTGGVAYDSSPVSDTDRSVVLPLGIAWRFGAGVQWQATPSLSFGAAYEFLWAGDMTVDQGTEDSLRGRVAGTYQGANFSFVTLNVNWRL
ncbi:MAG: outer membrane protein transport protein [Verrucomicrobiae bacterium]|nr:outer membrane protein transport protein [Verrucomicrobiae bacterium]